MALKDEFYNDEEIHQSTKTCLVPIDAWEHQKNLIKSYIKQVGSLLDRER